MARRLQDVIDQISGLLPQPPPPELSDHLVVLRSELTILRRTGDYTAPESNADEDLWGRLATCLYRYLPDPHGYAFAQQISDVVTVSFPASEGGRIR